jgi:hypothetical protein
MSSHSSFAFRLGYYQGKKYDETKGVENARRTTAFAKLYDKSESSAAKSKTQMCRSTILGTPCKFGNKCSFAHSKEELKTVKCAFGTACRTRCSKTNPCRFDHSEEVTPEAARQKTLAQEVKSFWDEEQLLEQAASAWISFYPKTHDPKPFLIQLDIFPIVVPGVTETVEENNSSNIDDEMMAIFNLASQPVKIFQVSADFNTMNMWEQKMPFSGSSLFTASV